MNKTRLLKISNIFLFFSMLIQALTGLMLYLGLFVTSPGLFKTIIEIHEYNGLLMTVLVLLHLVLNWGWIKAQFFKTGKSI
ncbi:MAG: DUF4405 domain-containing protein [Candidatus Omnitrophota bacterium]